MLAQETWEMLPQDPEEVPTQEVGLHEGKHHQGAIMKEE
jgi:hypothetical protein